MADNIARGIAAEEVAEALAEHGVPRVVAARLVASSARSPELEPARRQAERARRLALVLELQKRHRAFAAGIERIAAPEPETFFARYYANLVPVVLTDLTASWPALRRWSMSDLRERFGAVEIEACSGRDGDPMPDLNFAAHRERMTVAELVDRIAADSGNDLYLIANNHALDGPLRALLDDIEAPAYCAGLPEPGNASLWVGGAGTRTPLHLCDGVVGRPRCALVPPREEPLLEAPRGYDATMTVESVAQRYEVELGPGDTLFLPVGWWHEVVALTPSISISLLNFVRANHFPWYAPGGSHV